MRRKKQTYKEVERELISSLSEFDEKKAGEIEHPFYMDEDLKELLTDKTVVTGLTELIHSPLSYYYYLLNLLLHRGQKELLPVEKLMAELENAKKENRVSATTYESIYKIGGLVYSTFLELNCRTAPIFNYIEKYLKANASAREKMEREIIVFEVYGRHFKKIDWDELKKIEKDFYLKCADLLFVQRLINTFHRSDEYKRFVQFNKKYISSLLDGIKKDKKIEPNLTLLKDPKTGLMVPADTDNLSIVNAELNKLKAYMEAHFGNDTAKLEQFLNSKQWISDHTFTITLGDLTEQLYHLIPFVSGTSNNTKCQVIYFILQLVAHPDVEPFHIFVANPSPIDVASAERIKTQKIKQLLAKKN